MTGFAKRAAVAPRLLAKPVIGNSSRSEEHTSEPSHDQISYAVFCLKKKKKTQPRKRKKTRAKKKTLARRKRPQKNRLPMKEKTIRLQRRSKSNEDERWLI